MKVGDMVHWTLGDTISSILGHTHKPITGIIVDFRDGVRSTTFDKDPNLYGSKYFAQSARINKKERVVREVRVLCMTGKLRWYPITKNKKVSFT